MKRFITLALFAFLLMLCVGCQSRQEKSRNLIQRYLVSEPYIYDVDSLIEAECGDAYHIALNDSACYQYAFNIVKIRKEYQEVAEVFRDQMDKVGLIDKRERIQCYCVRDVERYPDILKTSKMLDDIDSELSFQISQLTYMHLDDKECIGYYVKHKFRYKDNNGNSAIGNYYFLFDKDVKKILLAYNLDRETCKSILNVLNQFRPSKKQNILLSRWLN